MDTERNGGLATWVGRHELGTIISLLVLCAGLWGFVELADEVAEGDTASIDQRILLALRNPDDLSDPIGPDWLEELMRDFTGLGGVGVVTFLTVAATGFLLLEGKRRAMLLLLTAVIGGVVASLLLKWSFDRPRPDLVPHGSYVYTSSFPSGHSMMAAATYLTIGALLARMHSDGRTKAYFLVLATLLTVAVGFSRVYLGVHWPTDVLAGWTIGGCWALLCWTVARYLQRRGDIEPAAPSISRADASTADASGVDT
ncbi:MAG: phosphatase PAP2 family protein [Planctomycetaceae bacterium]|nr:phosphatase PAP2 family protein [Planctomycetaceae bacterium]